MIIMVTGGRDYLGYDAIKAALQPWAKPGNVLIHGGARGADTAAHEIWTDTFQLPSITVPARWDATGKAAGQVRNLTMLKGLALAPHATLVPDIVLAFPGGGGTAHAVKSAAGRDIMVLEYD